MSLPVPRVPCVSCVHRCVDLGPHMVMDGGITWNAPDIPIPTCRLFRLRIHILHTDVHAGAF